MDYVFANIHFESEYFVMTLQVKMKRLNIQPANNYSFLKVISLARRWSKTFNSLTLPNEPTNSFSNENN